MGATATFAFVTPEEHAAALQRIERLEQLLGAHVIEQDEWLPTDQAVRKAGVKNRDILEKYARASRPNTQEVGRITWRKQGTKCQYSRRSCIDYDQHKLGQPTLTALAA
jgi:hypothetical protein